MHLIEDSLIQPNGITMSPDGSTLYISDTGSATGPILQSLGSQGYLFNSTGPRSLYAFNVSEDGLTIGNKRVIYQAIDFAPDGLKTAKNGLIVTATGKGVDVLDERGALILRVQTNYTVQNFAWTGEELKTLWITGTGGISKIEWNLEGRKLV